MTVSTVEYTLQDGYIHHWLAAGPQVLPVPEQDQFQDLSVLAKNFYLPKSGITQMPVERGPLEEGLFKIGEYEGSWNYTRCSEDHCIDHSAEFASCNYLRSWAYTQIGSPDNQIAAFILFVHGPADVWINHQHVLRRDQFTDRFAGERFEVDLKAGVNEVLVRFESVARLTALQVMAMRVDGRDLSINIPTLIPSLGRRNELEEVYEGINFDRDVYIQDEIINLKWSDGLEKAAYNDVYFRASSGWIQGHAEDVGKPNDTLFLGHPISLPEGYCRAQVMPRAWEFYESHIRISKELTAYNAGRSRHSLQTYGTLAERKQEALAYAVVHEGNLFAEIAKIALGRWTVLDSNVLKSALAQVDQRQEGSIKIAIALASTLKRFGSKPEFPKWLKKMIRDSLCAYRYSPEEPGADLMDFHSEANQILFNACEILVGQMFPQVIFKSGITGQKHIQNGEQKALAWMQSHGQVGFSGWNSSSVYADVMAGLSILVDQVRSEPVWGMASVLMDKMFFSLALNSYRGVLSSSQGCAQTLDIKCGMLEATSGISRIMWGMGSFNLHLFGLVMMALMRKYTLPPILEEISSAQPNEIWSLEQQAGSGQSPVNTVLYRTPDGAISSAQDYRPGSRGECEHIWQATLGPKSKVFTNHPASRSEKDFHNPNYWRGNGVLPRVAQWKDTLIAIYNLPEDDLLGYTHAWFPEIEFDETTIKDGWAFARKSNGYLALTASTPVEMVRQGPTTNRELRAMGSQVVWVCQLGRMAVDGSFQEFQDKILAAEIKFAASGVDLITRSGEQLSFHWEGPFLRNGVSQPLNGFKHFENNYSVVDFPCEQMEIKTNDYIMRLDFGGPP